MTDHLPDPPWRLVNRPTPLHFRTSELCRTNLWTARNGFTLVDIYDGLDAEYTAIRNACAISDRSHLIAYRIDGADAAGYLNRLAGGCGGALATGQTRHVAICDDDGALIVEALVQRPADGEWLLTVAAPMMDWLQASARGFDVAVHDVSEEAVTIALEGPTACAALLSAGFGGIEALRPSRVTKLRVAGADVTVARISGSGDLGYEIRVPADDARIVYDRIRRDGAVFGVRPAGEQALALARLEAGHAVPGVDYVPATHTSEPGLRMSPLALGLGRLLDFDGPYFTGRRALERQRRSGARRSLVGLVVEGATPLADAAVMSGRMRAGRITSTAWSPATRQVIALASVEAAALGASDALVVADAHGERRGARIAARPFFRHPRARRTPPSAY